MRPAALAFTAIGFLASAAAAAWVASYAVHHIEGVSTKVAKNALVAAGQTWVEIGANGTWVELSGTAPEENDRIQALTVVSSVVSASRIVDTTEVAESVPAVAPDFAMEILRSGYDVSLIGITPADGETDIIRDTIAGMEVDLIDMKETTSWDAPEGWVEALTFGAAIMADLERAKISIKPGEVGLIAVVENEETRDRIVSDLTANTPEGVILSIDITAPRPIFSPYNLLFIGGETPTLRCHALTEDGAERIRAAAQAAGLTRASRCDIGLGAPTDDWAAVAVAGINAVAEMQGGKFEIRDSNASLTAPLDFDADRFDQIVEDLEAKLPPAYMLIPSLPVTEAVVTADRPWFTAIRPAEGLVELSGMVIDDISAQTVATFAEARFGFEQIDDRTDIAEFAPHGWTSRQIVAVDVLSVLNEGEVTFTEDTVTVTGSSHTEDATDVIQQKLEAGFGADARFSINVDQLEVITEDPDLPDATQCRDEIANLLADQQILFAPSSAVIEADSEPVIGEIAVILNRCNHAAFEVGGHTDSQGGEVMNRNLSQNRADAVVDALLAQNLLLGNLTAVGYGESQPIGDNETEEGRAANRRIEFRLLTAEEVAAMEAAAQPLPPDVERADAPLKRPEDLNVELALSPGIDAVEEETDGTD